MRIFTYVGLLGVVGLAGVTNAASVGLNVAQNTTPVLDSGSLGVTGVYQQTHWNNFINGQLGATGVKDTFTTALGDDTGNSADEGPFLDSAGSTDTNFAVVWAGSDSSNSWSDTGSTAPPDSGPRIDTAAAANNLYNGYSYTQTGGNTSFEFQNIPYSSYSIVVYGDSGTTAVTSNNGVTGFDDVTGLPENGTPVDQGSYQLAASATWTVATDTTTGNYFVLSGLTGSDQTLTFVSSVGQTRLKAFQIVDNGGTAVPEPASLSLLSLAE